MQRIIGLTPLMHDILGIGGNNGGYNVIKQLKGYRGISMRNGQGHKPKLDIHDLWSHRCQLIKTHQSSTTFVTTEDPYRKLLSSSNTVRLTKTKMLNIFPGSHWNYTKAESALKSCLSWPFHLALWFCLGELRGSCSFRGKGVFAILSSKLPPKGLLKS